MQTLAEYLKTRGSNAQLLLDLVEKNVDSDFGRFLTELAGPIPPAGYRLLEYGEMMQDGDLLWSHPGQWEPLTPDYKLSGPTGYEKWSTSFRPMARKSGDAGV